MSDQVLRSRKKTSAGTSNGVVWTEDDDVLVKGKKLQLLGYRHWLLLAFFITILYHTFTHIDSRYPPLTDERDFSVFSEIRTRRLLVALTSEGPRPSGEQNIRKCSYENIP